MVVPKLSDVCLCAIVRDEMMNPAGGIVDFLDCTVPFVESAVVVDTGSKDGTRERLEKAKRKYSHLQIFDYEFDGFAQARNFSLQMARNKAEGKYALVLDADERLFGEDFVSLEQLLKPKPKGVNFQFTQIFPEAIRPVSPGEAHNPRCFSLELDLLYRNSRGLFGEILYEKSFYADEAEGIVESSISIKHFNPSIAAVALKHRWYFEFHDPQTQNQKISPDFKYWKQLNPHRAKYQ